MAVANLGVVLRPPDVTLDAKVLLPKRLDLARDAESGGLRTGADREGVGGKQVAVI